MNSNVEQELFERIIDALKEVIDPELGINIVDLGLVYEIKSDEDDDTIIIYMTLTSMGCPLSEFLEQSVAEQLQDIAVSSRVHWVWSPPWNPSCVTDDGREMLRSLGFAV